MARIIVLDSGPLGLASKPPGNPDGDRCRAWLATMDAAGALVMIPEIAHYEVRRELIRVRATAGLRRLDRLIRGTIYIPITTDAVLLAAQLWADARWAGRPTASPDALDSDVILAAQARLTAGHGDLLTVATGNVGHLGQFLDARPWETILA